MDFSINYYQVLGLTNKATEREIKKSYYKLSFVHHPDKGGDSKVFNLLTEAYDILMNEKLKDEYDNRSKWGSNYDESLEFLDYQFDNLANGWDEQKLKDFKKRESLNIVQYVDGNFNGTIEYERWVICKECKGSGKDNKSKIEIKDKEGNILKIFDSDGGCDYCEGSGKDWIGNECGFCFGQGKVGAVDCKSCNGEKRILGKQKLSGIEFPKDQKDHKVEMMGNFSKDIPGKVGHLWLVRRDSQ